MITKGAKGASLDYFEPIHDWLLHLFYCFSVPTFFPPPKWHLAHDPSCCRATCTFSFTAAPPMLSCVLSGADAPPWRPRTRLRRHTSTRIAIARLALNSAVIRYTLEHPPAYLPQTTSPCHTPLPFPPFSQLKAALSGLPSWLPFKRRGASKRNCTGLE